MLDQLQAILDARTRRPQAIAEAAGRRKRRASLLGEDHQLLGGEVSADQDAAFDRWHKALQMPSVRGLVVGRTLLFPPDDDVAGAVEGAVSLMRG